MAQDPQTPEEEAQLAVSLRRINRTSELLGGRGPKSSDQRRAEDALLNSVVGPAGDQSNCGFPQD
jgi:hypothetical protein